MSRAPLDRMRDSLTRPLVHGSRAAVVVAVVLAAGPAVAEPSARNAQPSVFGAQAGVVHTEAEAMNDVEASGTLGVFFRRGFSHRWALQFDLGRVRHDGWSIVSSSASVMHAFGSSRWLVPLVRGGVGFDFTTGMYDESAVHAEAAAVLELHLDGGFVLGGDLSIGARNSDSAGCPGIYVDDQPGVGPDACAGVSVFRSTYRAAKLTLGVAF